MVKAKKTTKKEPSPSAILKKMELVTDTNKAIHKEIKTISKIFVQNNKVLISMKDMIDTLSSTLEHIEKHSKQISIVEEDTQKLYSKLSQVRMQSDLVGKINTQTIKLQSEMDKIAEIQNSSSAKNLSLQVKDSMNSIQNNSQMIIKIAQRVDQVRDQLRDVAVKTDSIMEISTEIDRVKSTIKDISLHSEKIIPNSQILHSLKDEFQRITNSLSSNSNLNSELDAIKVTIDAISSKASKIDSLGGVIDGLQEQFKIISSKTDSIHGIEEKMTSIFEALKRQDESAVEFHKQSDQLFQDIQTLKNTTTKASHDSSKEVMALLKLSEYQSQIRMNAESKYGDSKNIEKMASQTADIVNLFESISIESDQKIPFPHDVRQWATSKILDCADRWEIRFSDVYSILVNSIGREMLKETIQIRQVRDIYGIRAVDEIRKDLNIS